MDREIRLEFPHELAAEQNTESHLIIHPLSIQQQFICRDHKIWLKIYQHFTSLSDICVLEISAYL